MLLYLLLVANFLLFLMNLVADFTHYVLQARIELHQTVQKVISDF
jgi:hypothetical protein